MKNSTLILFVLVCSALVIVSCSKDKKDTNTLSVSCQNASDTIYYAVSIAPIMAAHCTGCHGVPSNDGGINLETYQNVKSQTQDGQLLCSIAHECGVATMPKGAAKLSDAQIQTVACWKATGYQN